MRIARDRVGRGEMTYVMSGSRVLPSGVGTAIEIASISRSRDSSVVASNFPASRAPRRSALGTS